MDVETTSAHPGRRILRSMVRLGSFITLALVALVLAPLTSHAEDGEDREPVTVQWSSQGDALTYDPHAANETTTIAAMLHIYESLIRRGPDLKMQGALAHSWAQIDPTIWEFNLREGVRFHDGTAFTAQDVAFSITRAQSVHSDYSTFVEDIDRVEIIDDFTVRFISKGPSPLMLENLEHIFIMSQAWAITHDVVDVQDRSHGEETYAVRHTNGTGAFKLELREPDVRTLLLRNEDWWGLEQFAHNIDRIIYRPIANNATRVAALLSGELDFLLDPPLQDLARIARAPGLKLKTTPEIRTIFLGLDQGADRLRSSDVVNRNPFADRKVREAIYRAINVPAIQRAIMRGHAAPAGQLIAEGVNGHDQALDVRLEFDPSQAKALLREAGYEDGFSVTLDCPNDRYINDEAICQAIVSMLARVDIRVTLDSQPKSLHFPKIENRTTDFFMLGWGVPTLDSGYVFSYLYRGDGAWNATGYRDEAMDELIAAIAAETDVAKRNGLIKDAWEKALDEIVYVPLHHQLLNWAMRDRFDVPIMVDNIPRFFWARVTP